MGVYRVHSEGVVRTRISDAFCLNCIGDVTVGPRPYFLLIVVS
jgi:hypothetical protein